MKTLTDYHLYIQYSRGGKWHSLKRKADTAERAQHIATEISKVHTKTTRIAVVEQKRILITLLMVRGAKTFLEPRKMAKCNQCGTRRKNKNINPKTGTCLVCEMRNATDNQTFLILSRPAPEELI